MQHKKQWVVASSRKNYSAPVVNVVRVRRGVVYRVSLGIVDSFVFEISKLLVTVFDEIEYRSAKRASLKAARKPANTLKPSQELSPDSYEFQNEPSESA
jgi:hypothetical protein